MNYQINKPKSGATLRVWEIADEITAQTGRMAKRGEVIETFVAEGGNSNTASTQFHYWKTAQSAAADNGIPAASGDGVAELRDGEIFRLSVTDEGRLQLPRPALVALGVPNGGTLSARLDNGQLVLIEPIRALRSVQGMLAGLTAEGESVVDEFLSERRALWAEE